jgi:hypothetical protein
MMVIYETHVITNYTKETIHTLNELKELVR